MKQSTGLGYRVGLSPVRRKSNENLSLIQEKPTIRRCHSFIGGYEYTPVELRKKERRQSFPSHETGVWRGANDRKGNM